MINHIKGCIDENCAVTLKNLVATVRLVFNVQVSSTTISRSIQKFRYSLKRIQKIAVAADTPANAALRAEYATWYLQMTSG
jgi:hypothetical protein